MTPFNSAPVAGTLPSDENGTPMIDDDWESLWPRSPGPLFLLDNVQKIIKQGSLFLQNNRRFMFCQHLTYIGDANRWTNAPVSRR
jgi:hypothetical protein